MGRECLKYKAEVALFSVYCVCVKFFLRSAELSLTQTLGSHRPLEVSLSFCGQGSALSQQTVERLECIIQKGPGAVADITSSSERACVSNSTHQRPPSFLRLSSTRLLPTSPPKASALLQLHHCPQASKRPFQCHMSESNFFICHVFVMLFPSFKPGEQMKGFLHKGIYYLQSLRSWKLICLTPH